jgi:hypothetical protein
MKLLYNRIWILLISLIFSPSLVFSASPADTIKQIPFIETWDSASFSTNNWTFPWAQGNWSIMNSEGNPSPCAGFPGNPNQSNYINALLSPWFNATDFNCDDVYLDFDLKLLISNPSGTEKLRVMVEYDTISRMVATLNNTGNINWETFHIKLNVLGTVFRIRFIAYGTYSYSVNQWLIDNIAIRRECHRPHYIDSYSTGDCSNNCVTYLSWQPPDCSNTWGIINLIYDDGSPENGYIVETHTIGWIGNEFPVSPVTQGVLKSFEMYFWYNPAHGNDSLTIDIFDATHNLIGSSLPFIPTNDGWMTVSVADIPFSGMFYTMVKWNMANFTNWLGYDYDGPYTSQNYAWFFNGATWQKLSASYYWANPGVFLLRASVELYGKKKMIRPGKTTPENGDSTDLIGYNIYRAEAFQTNFIKINNAPVQEPNYTDPLVCASTYCVTAVYSNNCESPASDTIYLAGCYLGFHSQSLKNRITISPNPASDYLEIKSDYCISVISVTDLLGKQRYQMNVKKEKTIRVDLPVLPDGIYLLTINTEKGQQIQKIVILH